MITEEQMTDFLIDASFGNFSWFEYSVIPSKADQVGAILELDDEGNRIGFYSFTHATVERGFAKLAEQQGTTVEDLFDGYDCVDADNVIQLALFNTIRYS